MNKIEYYSNFKRFSKSGDRFSIFGREVNGELEIWKLKCCKEDVENNLFSKHLAKTLYQGYLRGVKLKGGYNPTIEYIPLEEDSLQYKFKCYCELFWKHDIVVLFDREGGKGIATFELHTNGEEVKVSNLKQIKQYGQ